MKVLILFLALILPVLAITEEDLIALIPRSPLPTTNDLLDVHFHQQTGVMVGAHGTVLASRDGGKSWRHVAIINAQVGDSQIPQNLYGVAYHGGSWVVVSSGGRWGISTDLINWEVGELPGSINARGLVFGNGRFVTVSTNGDPLWSTDGRTWQQGTKPPEVTRARAIAFGNGLFVAAGIKDIMVSADGESWNQIPWDDGRNILNVSYAGDRFVLTGVSGLVATSMDGNTWVIHDAGTTRETLSATRFSTGLFLLTDNFEQTFETEDFETFTRRDIPSRPDVTRLRMTPDGGIIALGDIGAIVTRDSEEADWISRNEAVSNSLSSVAFGDGTFVVYTRTGMSQVLTSQDGVRWQETYPLGNGVRTDPIFAKGIFALIDTTGQWISSPDGLNWSETPSDLPFAAQELRCLNNQWVATSGDGQIAWSDDGTSWEAIPAVLDNAFLRDITYGDGLYIAVGLTVAEDNTRSSFVLSSPDLMTWTERSVTGSTATDYGSVTFGNGRFVLYGRSQFPAFSEDGITWARLPNQTSFFLGVNTGYDEELGFYEISGRGTIRYFPRDGELEDRFTDIQIRSSSFLHSLASGNGLVVAIGSEGTILSSPITNSSYDAWVIANFGEDAPEIITGIGRDPDQDGADNLEEYLRGTDPNLPTTPWQLTASRSNGQATISLERLSGRTDVVVQLEYSTDLKNWQSAGQDFTQEQEDLGNNRELLHLTLSGEEGRQPEIYLRVRMMLITSVVD